MKRLYSRLRKCLVPLALATCMGVIGTPADAQMTLEIGTSGTSTTSNFPIRSCWGYSYTQQIYLASEMEAAGSAGPGIITKIAFKTSSSVVSVDNFKDWVIYMGNTTAGSFTSATSWVPYSDLIEVWSGELSPLTASTWIEFELTTPFVWDGTSNIVVAVDENTPNFTCSQNWMAFSTGSVKRGIYYSSDGTNPNPESPPSATSYTNTIIAQVQFEYTPAIGCEEVEFATGTLSGGSVCPSTPFTVTNSGSMAAAGVSRVWQQRVPAGTGTWTTIAGATGLNLYVASGITEPTDFRCIVTCDASGETDTTNIATFTLNPFLDCYCAPIYTSGCSGGAKIDDFITSGGAVNISNTGSGCATGMGYTDYSDEHQIVAMQLSDITQSTKIISFSAAVKIWVDWNQDGYFHPTDELVAATGSTISAGSTFTSTFTVPLTALPGETRMRVRAVESTTAFDPCSSHAWGETEDYTFIVVPATPCSDASITFPTEASASSNPEMVCGTGDVTLSVVEDMPIAMGITYKWQSAPSPTGPWTDISGELINDEFFYEGVSSNTYFRCLVLCEGTEMLTTSAVFVESVVPEAPILYDGEHCGPGSVTLTGEATSGTIFWFETPTGGTPFAVGDTIETPELEETTTFYAAAGAFPPGLVQVGTATTTTTGAGPYHQVWRRTTVQMMYTAEQLLAAGAMPGTFDEIRFYLASPIVYDFPGYTLSIKMVPSSMTTLVWQTDGFTEIFGGSDFVYSPEGSGWQSYTFDPIYWDGVSNIVIQACWAQMADWTSAGGHQYTTTSGQMLYAATDAAGNSCGQTGTTSSSYLPNIIFNFNGCVSERVPVTAHIREVPTINIDVEDGEYCMFNNLFTIPTSPEQPESTEYLWSNGSTEPAIVVSGDGTPEVYWVEVTNEWGCKDSDTVHLTLKPSPMVDLGPDVTTCEGGTVLLDAGDDGTDYYWNTGETTQTIIADDGGSYWVLVTNEHGCMATDTINVTVEGFAPSVDGIIVENLGPYFFHFTPFHPMNVLSYHWDFGDGDTSSAMEPVHTYTAPGTYTVTLEVASSCGKREYYTYVTIAVNGVEEHELAKNNVRLYPNPTQNTLNIETLGDINMENLSIINVLGQEVLFESFEPTQVYSINVSRLPSGVYNLRIQTNHGILVKQFQVVK